MHHHRETKEPADTHRTQNDPMKPVSLPIALNLGPPALPRGAALFSWRWCGYRGHGCTTEIGPHPSSPHELVSLVEEPRCDKLPIAARFSEVVPFLALSLPPRRHLIPLCIRGQPGTPEAKSSASGGKMHDAYAAYYIRTQDFCTCSIS